MEKRKNRFINRFIKGQSRDKSKEIEKGEEMDGGPQKTGNSYLHQKQWCVTKA